MHAKRFFYVSVGILCLVLAYHFGATSATAQAPGNPVVAFTGSNALVTANGDVYEPLGQSSYATSWHRSSNIFSGPTPAQNETWGQLKARYR